MEENKRGGKRSGAGRKPSGVEKKTISLFVPKGQIYKFGNDEKMKQELYKFISSYGQEIKVNDLTKPTHQVKQPEPPQTNYVQQVLTKFDAYRREITQSTSKKQWQSIIQRLNADFLKPAERSTLLQIANKHFSENFFND